MGRERKLRAVKMADGSTVCVGEAFTSVDHVDFGEDDWEIVDPSDDEDTYSFDESTGENDEDDVVEHQIEDLESKCLDSFGSPSSDLSIPDPVVPMPELLPAVLSVQAELVRPQLGYDYSEEDYGDEDDEEEDDYDLDDELVPKWVNDRFGRQRMRKFGKKAYPKINKSKRSAYYYHRPGCVHGKHGLGLKHSLI